MRYLVHRVMVMISKGQMTRSLGIASFQGPVAGWLWITVCFLLFDLVSALQQGKDKTPQKEKGIWGAQKSGCRAYWGNLSSQPSHLKIQGDFWGTCQVCQVPAMDQLTSYHHDP